MIVVIGLAHRAVVFVTHASDLDALVTANPDWYTFQHLPIALLRDNLSSALLYLQQTPPLPNLIIGIVLKLFAWPHGVARALIALCGVLGILSALALWRTLTLLLRGRVWTSAIVAVVFLLTTDLLVIEYNSFGQTFYELLTMLFVTCLAYRFACFLRTAATRDALYVGLLTAALALTRSTWAFFWGPAAAVIALTAVAPRRRALVAFALPVLLLQGSWLLKTRVVYGHWAVGTSSWTGYHLAKAMYARETRDMFERFMKETNAARENPLCLGFHPVVGPSYVLPDAVDQEIARQLGQPNPPWNRSSYRRHLDECAAMAVFFFFRHPRAALTRTLASYRLFWRPPAQYGRMFVALLAPDAPIRVGLSPSAILRGLYHGRLPARQFVMRGTFPRRQFEPTRFFTLRWFEPFTLLITMLGVHLLAPIALFQRRARREDRHTLLLLLLPYTYLAALSSLGEWGENMRFRIEVEPIIWLITMQSIVICWSAWAARGRAAP